MKRASRGFTLIEMMIAITLMAVLMTLVAPSFRDASLASQLFNLLPVELDLLLPAANVELPSVRLLTSGRRAGFALGQRQPYPLDIRLQLGDMRGRNGRARPRLIQPALSSVDFASESLVAPCELHLLPLTQVLSQLLVPPSA